jgi:hypothetical protein
VEYHVAGPFICVLTVDFCLLDFYSGYDFKKKYTFFRMVAISRDNKNLGEGEDAILYFSNISPMSPGRMAVRKGGVYSGKCFPFFTVFIRKKKKRKIETTNSQDSLNIYGFIFYCKVE